MVFKNTSILSTPNDVFLKVREQDNLIFKKNSFRKITNAIAFVFLGTVQMTHIDGKKKKKRERESERERERWVKTGGVF